MMAALADVDLTDPDLYSQDDGLDTLRMLQRDVPVHWHQHGEAPGFWALMRHADAFEVYEDRPSFSSEQGMQVGQDEGAAKAAAGKMLIVCDDPRHRQLRAIIGSALRPSVIRALEPAMRRVTALSLEEGLEQSSFDFVELVASRLPVSVICSLFAVPEADWPLMLSLTRTAFRSTASDTPITKEEAVEANAMIFAYYADLTAERRKHPGTDLLSELATARTDGEPLTDLEIVLNLNGLITGGNETTRHAASGAVIAFAEFPSQYDRLRHDEGLRARAVEEVLRWTAPSLNVMRAAVRDVVVGGQRVRAGERVAIWNPIVNRDPDAFPAPERFDVGRSPNPHLTFGLGQHHCVGAGLARLELRVLFDELVRRVGRIELAGPIKRLRSNLMWGVDRVPTTLHATKETARGH